MNLHTIRHAAASLLLLAAPQPAFAYIGPGAVLGAIAVTIALVLGVILLLAGFVWYPLKRLMKGRKAPSSRPEPGAPE